MSKPLAILGASGHGKVVADAALEQGWPEVVFFDDAWPSRTEVGRWPIAGDSAALLASLASFDGVVVGIGDNTIRMAKVDLLVASGAPLVSVIHPCARVSRFAELGVGSVMFVGAAVNVDVCVGRAAIINTGATVDHDCLLGDAVHISPGTHLAGNVTVGDRTWIGIGAVVRQGITIGKDVMVAAGAVVVRDVPDGATVMGVPGRVASPPITRGG